MISWSFSKFMAFCDAHFSSARRQVANWSRRVSPAWVYNPIWDHGQAPQGYLWGDWDLSDGPHLHTCESVPKPFYIPQAGGC
jgi:hypothetical protein